MSVSPVEGLGVLHFPALAAAHGGLTDYNAFHEAEPPEEPAEKWVAQQVYIKRHHFVPLSPRASLPSCLSPLAAMRTPA